MIASVVLCGSSLIAVAYPKSAGEQNMLEAERLLWDLGYWIAKVDGVADASTRHAITAFHNVEGRKRTGVLSADDVKALRTAARPVAKYPESGTHIEIDVARQVLFLTDDQGIVRRILPVSTGNEKKYFDQGKWQIAHTPRGKFAITRKLDAVRKAPLGNLYYPNYFYGGVAIHGSNSIPLKPASHGCVRIPRFADRAFGKMVPVGMTVYVYD